MKLNLSKALFVVPLLVASSSVQAATMTATYVGTVDQQTTDLTGVAATFAPPLTKFDSSLGLLIQVDVTYQGTGTTSITAKNTSASAGTFHNTTNVVYTLGSGDTGVDGLLGSLTFTGTSDSGVNNLASGASGTFGPYTYDVSQSATFTSAGDLARFIGSGPLTFLVTTATSASNSNTGGNINLNQDTQAGGVVTVTYTYQTAAVPEPSSALMLGLAGGLVGLGARLRKRRA